MPLPNQPNRRPTGRIGARPPGGSPQRGPAPRGSGPRGAPPPGPQGEAPAGRRGAPQEPGLDKRLIWGAVGAGVLIVGIIVGIQLSKKSPEEPAKKKDSGNETASNPDRLPNPETPEGRAEIEKGFVNWPPTKISKFIGVLSPASAVKIKDILIPYLLRLDVGPGYTDAWNIAQRVATLKDGRVLGKIIDLALKKSEAGSLLKPYGAMGAEAVIARAKGDLPNVDSYYTMLKACELDEANAPMVAAAETCDVPDVAWICGDALYDRNVPIQLARVQAWLADAKPRAQASGIRQMAIQKGVDRDAALAPFAKVDAARELQLALLKVLGLRHDLSTDHMKSLLATEDQELFEAVMGTIETGRLVQYIPVLEEIGAGPMNFKTRRVSKVALDLKNLKR